TEEDRARLTEQFGQPFLIMRNFFKRHACCRACFEGIEGIRHLLTANALTPEAVQQVRVTMKPARTWLVATTDPRDIYQAKFSLPFCMAVTVLRGDAGIFQFTEENLRQPSIREFMRKVSLVNDPAIATKARIEVMERDGTVRTAEPTCRSMAPEEVKEKFIKNTSAFLDGELVHSILSAVEHLEEVERIAELTHLLTHPASGRIAA
ncbi:MAG TPA: hypothetical protein VLM91_15660, partial [Candidatus Methylomirabilis sp.]|nr:hypothetical protein [Candidatus Methylomirabilis sp.]